MVNKLTAPTLSRITLPNGRLQKGELEGVIFMFFVHDDSDNHPGGDGATEEGEAGAELLCGEHLEEGVLNPGRQALGEN